MTELCTKITENKIEISSSLENRSGDLPIYITDNSKITQFSGWEPEINVTQLLLEIKDWFIADEKVLKSILA